MKGQVRTIQSVQRAIDILNCFNSENPKLSLAEISDKLGLNISTTRGIINTLMVNELVYLNAKDGKYRLGLNFIEKGNLVYEHNLNNIKEVASPFLAALSDKFKVSSRLQLLSNLNIFSVETVNPKDSHYILTTRIGTPLPLHSTASGKLALFYLPTEKRNSILEKLEISKLTNKTITDKDEIIEELEKIRISGYSIEDEETELGISSIAAPILLNENNIIGTISIMGPTTLINDILDNASKDLMYFAKNISSRIMGFESY